MKCANCGKLILDKGITYGINPTAICKCDNPKPVTPPDQDNSQTEMAKDLIQKFKPALTELQDSSTGGLREKINSLVDKYADVSIGDGQGGIDGYDYTIVDKLLDLIQSETDKARVDTIDSLKERFSQYTWGNYNPFALLEDERVPLENKINELNPIKKEE